MLITINFTSDFVEDLNTQVLRMPYQGESGRFSMYIFLPDKTTGTVDKLLQKLTATILNDILNGAQLKSQTFISVSLPKFSFEKNSELEPVSCTNY